MLPLREHYEPFVAFPWAVQPVVWMPIRDGNKLTIVQVEPPRFCEITGLPL